MPVYTVHAPATNGADLTATDKFAFVRDGFHFWAAVAGLIWLAWHRLWLALIGWTLSRRKWRQLDIVVADDEETAERRFFDRWTARNRVVNDPYSVDRGGPP